MKKKAPLILIFIVAAALIGGATGLYLFNKPHADLASQEPDFTVSSSELFNAFENDENTANQMYLDKLLLVKGIVQEKNTTGDGGVILIIKGEMDMFGVSCSFLPETVDQVASIELGSEISVKGVCTGMLMDVNLSRCILAN